MYFLFKICFIYYLQFVSIHFFKSSNNSNCYSSQGQLLCRISFPPMAKRVYNGLTCFITCLFLKYLHRTKTLELPYISFFIYIIYRYNLDLLYFGLIYEHYCSHNEFSNNYLFQSVKVLLLRSKMDEMSWKNVFYIYYHI